MGEENGEEEKVEEWKEKEGKREREGRGRGEKEENMVSGGYVYICSLFSGASLIRK